MLSVPSHQDGFKTMKGSTIERFSLVFMCWKVIGFALKHDWIKKTSRHNVSKTRITHVFLACENNRPSSLQVRVAFHETSLGPGAKKDSCFRRVTFSRASRQLHVITWSFDWFAWLSVSFVIGWSDYFVFNFTILSRKQDGNRYIVVSTGINTVK